MQAPDTKFFSVFEKTNKTRSNMQNDMIRKYCWIMSFLIASTFVFPANAQDQVLGAFKDWKAHTYVEEGATVCNMYSRPTQSKPSNVRRGDIYAFVTHRPALVSRSAVSFQMGYPLKTDAAATLTIGNQTFRLDKEGEALFARQADDAKILRAMRRGNRMIVRATSTRGTQTTDTYSLSGATAASNAINSACPS